MLLASKLDYGTLRREHYLSMHIKSISLVCLQPPRYYIFGDHSMLLILNVHE